MAGRGKIWPSRAEYVILRLALKFTGPLAVSLPLMQNVLFFVHVGGYVFRIQLPLLFLPVFLIYSF